MKHLFLISCFFALAHTASAATQLLYLDFEQSSDWDHIENNSVNGATRTTNAPYAGSWAMRCNLFEGQPGGVDPITSLPCANANCFSINWSSMTTPNGVYIRYYRRLDNSTWAPGDGNYGYGKGEYILMAKLDGTAGYGGEMLYSGLVSNGARIANQSMANETWINANWGTGVAYGSSAGGAALVADGDYDCFEFYLDYANDRIYRWVNGRPVTLSYGTSMLDKLEGGAIVPLKDGVFSNGWGFLYASDAQIADSTDGTNPVGYAGGAQFDNIEVWDGCPGTAGYSCTAGEAQTSNPKRFRAANGDIKFMGVNIK